MGLQQLLYDTFKLKTNIYDEFGNSIYTRRDGGKQVNTNRLIETERSRRSWPPVSICRYSERNLIPSVDISFSLTQPVSRMGLGAGSLKPRKDEVKFPVLVKSIDNILEGKRKKMVVTTSNLVTSSSLSASDWKDLEEAEGIYHTTTPTGDGKICMIFPPKYSEIIETHKQNKKSNIKIETIPNQPETPLNVSGFRAKCATRNTPRSKGNKRTAETVIGRSRRGSKDSFNKKDNMRSLELRMESVKSKVRPKTAIGQTDKPKKIIKPPKTQPSYLNCVNPSNVNEEREKFFDSNFTYNPQFEYSNPLSWSALQKFNITSSKYLKESIAILKRVLDRHGSYEKFESVTGGKLLNRTQIWNMVKAYLDKEGFSGDVVVNITNDILSRAAMTISAGRPTLSIRESSARQYWVEGLLRHEIGTHHLRFHNNRHQVWATAKARRQMDLKPANPTEEGLASIHSVLSRKDPALWRAAMLYYTVHKAAKLSFVDLFKDLGQFLDSPEVRWDYCIRTKRGQTDTSKPGCFAKDQVYLTGVLSLLEKRKTLDFHMLCRLGKVSHEDIERLRDLVNTENTKIPSFMKNIDDYRKKLDYIVETNGLEKFI